MYKKPLLRANRSPYLCIIATCENKKNPNKKACEVHSCKNGNCTGYIIHDNAYCGKCDVERCGYNGCNSSREHIISRHLRCSEHQEFKCSEYMCNNIIVMRYTVENVYCNLHRCKYCTNRKQYSDNKCVYHTNMKCAVCFNYKEENSSVCGLHKCSVNDCKMPCDRDKLCKDHRCKADYCSNARAEYDYCTYHRCIYVNCDKPKYTNKYNVLTNNSDFCTDHKCNMCENEAKFGRFCYLHKCAVNECKYGISFARSKYCFFHKCAYCSLLVTNNKHTCEYHSNLCGEIVDGERCTKYIKTMSECKTNLFCKDHSCYLETCPNASPCYKHKCYKCRNNKEDNGSYFCDDCKCPTEGCKNRKNYKKNKARRCADCRRNFV